LLASHLRQQAAADGIDFLGVRVLQGVGELTEQCVCPQQVHLREAHVIDALCSAYWFGFHGAMTPARDAAASIF
jgi:hypothetical protein